MSGPAFYFKELEDVRLDTSIEPSFTSLNRREVGIPTLLTFLGGSFDILNDYGGDWVQLSEPLEDVELKLPSS
jgi:hypothetical protein